MKKRKSNISKRHSRSCRNNGPCAYCRSSRTHGTRIRLLAADEKMQESR